MHREWELRILAFSVKELYDCRTCNSCSLFSKCSLSRAMCLRRVWRERKRKEGSEERLGRGEQGEEDEERRKGER